LNKFEFKYFRIEKKSKLVEKNIVEQPATHNIKLLGWPTQDPVFRVQALFTSPVFFIPERYGDIWGFGVHPILSNPLKYSSPKILYHDGEFLF
jgi:hypothetical protein